MSSQDTDTPLNPDTATPEETKPFDADPAADATADVPSNGDDTDPAALRVLLVEANARADAEHEAFLRARADFTNFKRRTEEERESLKNFLIEGMLTRLLPITDNFERALQAAEATKDYEKLVGGINAVYRQLADLLAREGVQTINALYEPFDPNMHEAVVREETTDYPENTVVAELQKGYTLNGRVLRPTMVKVSSGTE